MEDHRRRHILRHITHKLAGKTKSAKRWATSTYTSTTTIIRHLPQANLHDSFIFTASLFELLAHDSLRLNQRLKQRTPEALPFLRVLHSAKTWQPRQGEFVYILIHPGSPHTLLSQSHLTEVRSSISRAISSMAWNCLSLLARMSEALSGSGLPAAEWQRGRRRESLLYHSVVHLTTTTASTFVTGFSPLPSNSQTHQYRHPPGERPC